MVVVVISPGFREFPGVGQSVEVFQRQELVAKLVEEALGVTVFPRTAWGNVQRYWQ
jgi:hypothetical protein